MSTNIFLGYPPPKIKEWIEKNYNTKKNVPLHFTANEPNSSVSLIVDDGSDSWCEFVYSTDEMKTWNDYRVNTDIIQLDDCENKTVYFQAKYGDTEDNPNRNGLATHGENDESDINKYHQFVMEGSVKAGGNIQFLLDNTGLRMDVTPYCYYSMFPSCSSLTQAPELPATILASNCYYCMFISCTSLTQAPALPATTLADLCYCYMFADCKSLTQAPELPATTLAYGCYNAMFDNCASLTQAPELPATTLADDCYGGMFANCSSLTSAPVLPATELTESCYVYMCWNCKSPLTFPDKTFDEVASLIQEQYLIGSYWSYYDEEDNEIIINPIEIICSDKVMLATAEFEYNEEDDYNEFVGWTLTEK